MRFRFAQFNLKTRDDFVLAVEWFECNYMIVNQDKCHLLISGHKY